MEGLVLVVVLLGAASIGIYVVRRQILLAAGWVLVVNEHVGSADVIVVAVAVHSGVSTRVAVFADPPDTMVEQEFIRRGIADEDKAARSLRQLRALGVDTIDLIPGYVAGSDDEGPALAYWCDQHRFRSVVVVSSSDHSRRLRRVLHRSMKGHQTRLTVRCSRYLVFDPDRWWESHGGIRTEIEELEKLLLDVMRHPIS
jgi:hypothetical protein